MKKAIQISIPEPCHEDWAKMTPSQKGRHCESCKKEVTDYTQKTDEQLVKLLSKSGTSCGRFKKSQINREVKLDRKSSQALAPYAASLLIPLSLMSSINTEAATSETKIENTYKSIGIGRLSRALKAKITTTGIILDKNGNPINDVEIYVKETGHIFYSNHKGVFAVTSSSAETLVFEKAGFISFTYTTTNYSREINITLENDSFSIREPMIMGGIRPSIEKPIEIGNMKIDEDSANSNVKVIKGTVTDSSGLPLPGTNIVIKGTSIGTQSDFDGLYAIEVMEGQTLVYSYVGFDKNEILINAKTSNLNVALYDGLTGEIVIVSCDSSNSKNNPMVTKPDFYANESEVKDRRNRYQNTLSFLKLKIARKKEARKVKREERKATKKQAKKN